MNLNLELLPPNHPLLKEPTQKFDFDDPPMPPDHLFMMLSDIMIKNKGIGLAANQIGIPYNVFVIGDPTNEDSIISVFNPNIISRSGEQYYAEEGCLTFPDLYVKIKRYNVIRTRFTTHDGDTDTIKLSGMTSRIFQHEYDHLHGILYTKRANPYHLDKAKRDLKKVLKLRKRNAKKS